ncbi:hypothetical protein C1752_01800 [Acaryochloris thomasi RCC1774]|uniref:Uncharacterized protein n=1 Tax=Acaryochloris thomasi RCC1774 TaxID=1764569 RepID=A0A2W1JL14_9CYAN|nr:hypothetical protein C1752_01800 [Acaryochloris thomasi RCC1774]
MFKVYSENQVGISKDRYSFVKGNTMLTNIGFSFALIPIKIHF